MSPRIPRRWAAAGLFFAAAALTVAAAGGAEQAREHAAKPTHRFFRSRPDLRPPILVVNKEAPRAASYIFLAPKKKGRPGGPMILDGAGDVVWFHPVQPREAADFRMQRYRGRPVLTWWEGTQPTIGIGAGKFVIMDSSYRRIAELRAGNGFAGDLHEFLITRRNTALIIAYEKRRRDLRSVGGPRDGYVWNNVLQELDVPTGRVLFEWHSVDHVPVAESAQRKPARRASLKAPFDYFHANSIDVDTDGNFLVSARNASAVYKISRRTGKVIWRLGGRKTDFTMRPGTQFAWQHDARRQADGTITLFDNSAIPKVAEQSRALVLRLDLRTKVASLVRAYAHPARLLSPHQGNAQRVAGGGLFVGWGGKPYLTEFSKGGDVVFDARLAVGDTYRAYRFPWKGEPSDRPAVAANARADGRVVAYASWNGATDVARWQVLAGASPNQLRVVGAARKRGFETRIAVRTSASYVAARALDANGKTLRTSRTERVR